MLKVYLSGYANEEDYRKYAIEKYGEELDLFDPIKEMEGTKFPWFDWNSFRAGLISIDDSIISPLVESEKEFIKYNCDVLVAYMVRYSAGTIMEIKHAYENNIPVYIIDPTKKFSRDIWLIYHTNVFFDSIDSCFEQLLKL